MTPLQRRHCLVLSAAWPALHTWEALAQPSNDVSAKTKALLALGLSSEGMSLEFPRLADTGNAVPLQVQVQAPPGLTVSALEVILPENPNPSVVKLRLLTPVTHYRFATRLRLAASQDAWVVATLSDGSQRGIHAPTLITSSACFDAT